MVIGAPGILTELEELGFQTFENLFDQSYDTVPDIDDKLKIIRNNKYLIRKFSTSKLAAQKYRQQLFYNTNC